VVVALVDKHKTALLQATVCLCVYGVYGMYYVCMYVMYVWYLQRGADKSLARLTSRCPRTESIVALERGACSCAELQVVSCYRG